MADLDNDRTPKTAPLSGSRWETLREDFASATGIRLRMGQSPGERSAPVHTFGVQSGWVGGEADPQALEAAARLAGLIIESRITNDQLIQHLSRLWREINFVYEFSETLGQPLGIEESCHRLLELALDVVGAERGSIYLVDRTMLVPVAARGVPDAFRVAIPRTDPQSIAAWVVRHGTPMILNDAARRPPSLATHAFAVGANRTDSLMSVPLAPGTDDQEPQGVLNLAGKVGGHFTTEDEQLVAAIGRLAAGAIQRNRLLSELLAAERLREEVRLAGEIHAGLLPKMPPELPGFELAGGLRPASEVGGDYYDFVRAGDRLYLLIADVAGHGLTAALFVSTVRSALRTACRAGLSPGAVLGSLNDVVGDLAGETGLFATAQVVELNGSTGTLAAAAHPPALVLRAGASVTRVGNAGPPAGATTDPSYPEETFELREGDSLILYTDGLFEPDHADNLSDLEAALIGFEAGPAGDLVERLLNGDGTVPARDDRTALVVRRHATGAASRR